MSNQKFVFFTIPNLHIGYLGLPGHLARSSSCHKSYVFNRLTDKHTTLELICRSAPLTDELYQFNNKFFSPYTLPCRTVYSSAFDHKRSILGQCGCFWRRFRVYPSDMEYMSSHQVDSVQTCIVSRIFWTIYVEFVLAERDYFICTAQSINLSVL